MIDYIGLPKKGSLLLLALGVLVVELRLDRISLHGLKEQ
jgi:hypothetical protein